MNGDNNYWNFVKGAYPLNPTYEIPQPSIWYGQWWQPLISKRPPITKVMPADVSEITALKPQPPIPGMKTTGLAAPFTGLANVMYRSHLAKWQRAVSEAKKKEKERVKAENADRQITRVLYSTMGRMIPYLRQINRRVEGGELTEEEADKSIEKEVATLASISGLDPKNPHVANSLEITKNAVNFARKNLPETPYTVRPKPWVGTALSQAGATERQLRDNVITLANQYVNFIVNGENIKARIKNPRVGQWTGFVPTQGVTTVTDVADIDMYIKRAQNALKIVIRNHPQILKGLGYERWTGESEEGWKTTGKPLIPNWGRRLEEEYGK